MTACQLGYCIGGSLTPLAFLRGEGMLFEFVSTRCLSAVTFALAVSLSAWACNCSGNKAVFVWCLFGFYVSFVVYVWFLIGATFQF